MIRLCISFLLLCHGNCFLFNNCADMLSVTCGEPLVQPITARIVGGQEASIGSLPWMVALAELGFFMCSGAIINNRFVLTAAHCFERNLLIYGFINRYNNGRHEEFVPPLYNHYVGKTVGGWGLAKYRLKTDLFSPSVRSFPLMEILCDGKCLSLILRKRENVYSARISANHPSRDPLRWLVLAGKHSLFRTDVGEVSYRVEKIILHPDYNNITGSNDIALLMLSESIIFTSLIMPLCLPSYQQIPDPGQACIVAGWGLTLDTGNLYVLNQVTIPVISDDVCSQDDWQGDLFIPQQMFCAGVEDGGKDACMGDSGSPFTCSFGGKWFANGIVSMGNDCAVRHKPGIYTNVSHYIDWLQQTMVANCIVL